MVGVHLARLHAGTMPHALKDPASQGQNEQANRGRDPFGRKSSGIPDKGTPCFPPC